MPTRRLPSDPDLEHLKGQAKALQRAVRAGDPAAVGLVREHHPRLGGITAAQAASFSRADAQLVVARGHGFPNWPKLRRHVETVSRYSRAPHRQPVGGPIRDRGDLVDELLRLACLTYDASVDHASRRRRAGELLAQHPELSGATIHAAAAIGDEAAARAVLAEDPTLANLTGGPYDWEPLLYLAYSRLEGAAPGQSTLEVARLLLESGADPNAGYLWEGLPSPFTALTGAFGRGEGDPPPHRHRLALARLLLDAGADPNDAQTIYNLSWTRGDDWLELLLERGLGRGSGGPWHARLAPAHPAPAELVQDALLWATLYGFPERVRLLLRHGVEVDGHGTRHPLVRGRTAWRLATLSGSVEIADALAAAGAGTALDRSEALVAACMRGDRRAVDGLLAEDPALAGRAIAQEPDAVLRAAELGRRDALGLLVRVGFDVSAPKRLPPRGMTALHQAALDGDLDLVRILVELGADHTVRDAAYDATPQGWAEHGGHREVAAYLGELPPPG